MSLKPDFSNMTKEEIADYYEKKLSEQAAAQNKIIMALRKENSEISADKEQEIKAQNKIIEAQKKEIEVINSDREKLTQHNKNFSDLIRNILSNIKERHLICNKLLKEEAIPSVDEANIKELNSYFENFMSTVLNALETLHLHQTRALNLGNSEKNTGGSPDYSADDEAQREGAAALDSAGEAELSDTDQADFIEQSESVVQKDRNGKKRKETPSLDNETVKDFLISNCSNQVKDNVSQEADVTALVIDEFQRSQSQDLEKAKATTPEKRFVSLCNSERVAGIITNAGKTTITMECPSCHKQGSFKINGKKKRINSTLTLTGGFGSLGTVLSSVHLATCPYCGENFEINPATLTDVSLTVSNEDDLDRGETQPEQGLDDAETKEKRGVNTVRNTQSALESDFSEVQKSGVDKAENYPDKASDETGYTQETTQNHAGNVSEQKYRKEIFNKIKNSENRTQTDCLVSGNLLQEDHSTLPVIDPTNFNAYVFGMTPAFSKSRMSVALLTACGTIFAQLGAPKNRAFNFFEGNGFPMTREHLTGCINAFARAYLHPVCKQIRKEIILNCPAVVMDESTLLVRETATRKQAMKKGRKSQIWVLSTNWTSEYKGSWYCVSENRSKQNVIDILGDELKSENSPLKYLISDGYAGYDSAIKVLNEQGVTLKSCRCYAHARRPLHYYLKNTGLLKIYNNYLLPTGAKFSDFNENLKKYRATKKGEKLSDSAAELLTIYWMINALFVIDSTVVKKHKFACTTEEFKKDLIEVRRKMSSKIVDAIFDSVRLYIAARPDIVLSKINSAGEVVFNQKNTKSESRALIYLLNFEEDLRRFLESTDIELTSSKAERQLKLGIIARKSFNWLSSEDGAHAFADYQTIINSCILNEVPAQHYMEWLVANIKWRMNKKRIEGHDDPTFFQMPGRRKMVGSEETISMYDSRNNIGYDKIDVTGLTPYDYRKCLEKGLGI